MDVLQAVLQKVKATHRFQIDAMVILPDHLHAVWTLPVGDCDYATRWMLIKAGFSRRIAKDERRNKSRIAKGERGIWQRRYWEHLVRDESDYEKHVDYVHYNPAKHGYVERVSEWPHSTFHRYWLEAYIRPIGRVCMDSNWKLVNVRESLRWESFVIPTGR